MKIKNQLIMNFITLSLTAFLLVCIVTAWYVTNTTASVNGIIGSTADVDGITLNVKTYSLSASDNNMYEYKIDSLYTADSMSEYGDIDVDITAVLLEIEYIFSKETNKSYPLTLETNMSEAGCLNEFDSINNTGVSYLSNATRFYVCEKVDSYIDLEGEELSFVDNDDYSKTLQLEIENLTYQKEAGYVYLLIDYDSDLVNYLYNDLLQQTTEASLNSKIIFEEDLCLYVRT